MILLIGSTKGGVGKSTVAVNLAAWRALHGYDVVLLDTDVQRHASGWAYDRAKRFPALPKVAFAHAHGRDVSVVAKRLGKERDVIVDAGGRDSYELRSALRVADVLVSPVVASLFDLRAMRDLVDVLDEAQLVNERLVRVAFLNKVSGDARLKDDEWRARQVLDGWADKVTTLANKWHLRRPFLLSVEDGRAVFEMENRARSAAGDEVASLWSEVETMAGLKR